MPTRFKLILSLILFFVGGFLLGQSYKLQPAVVSIPETQVENQDISLMFTFDSENIQVFEQPWADDVSLFEATQAVTTQEELGFTFDDYGDLGILVSQIGNKINGTDDHYWQYWVNNEQIQIAANSYFVAPGDVINWQFRKSAY